MMSTRGTLAGFARHSEEAEDSVVGGMYQQCTRGPVPVPVPVPPMLPISSLTPDPVLTAAEDEGEDADAGESGVASWGAG